MKNNFLFFLLLLVACIPVNDFLTSDVPYDKPLVFKPELIPEGMLIHSGIFSPDLEEYYFTLSDKDFTSFTVKKIRKENGRWSEPEDAFFNTKYFEHGMNFSPDGNTIYFSSTRPTEIKDMPETWHIWRSQKIKEKWSEPEFIDIPNLRNRMISHPSVTKDGTIYFHSGTPNYKELQLFYSKPTADGKFGAAIKLPEIINFDAQMVTPWIAPDESYIIFQAGSKIHLSFKAKNGNWEKPQILNNKINKYAEGNPYVSPDEQFLFYAAGTEADPKNKWTIHWVNIITILDKD